VRGVREGVAGTRAVRSILDGDERGRRFRGLGGLRGAHQ
jgi:hypothetical protein